MSARLKLIVPSLLAASLFPGFAEGQLVEVRRGYVRAPFVRVQRRGMQRSRVRAPFVELGGPQGTPQYATPAQKPTPVPPAEPEPTAVTPQVDAVQDVAQLDASALERTIIVGEAELDRALDEVAAGDHWRRLLHVGRLRELLTAEDVALEPDQSSEELQQILESYHQALINPASRAVTQLDGFQTVQPALRELLLSPAERQLGRLVAASRELEAELGTMQNGAIWAEHLRLPPGLEDGTATTPAYHDALTSLLSRFDTANSNARNRPVTELSTFQTTYEYLSVYVDLFGASSVPATEPVSVDEPMVIRQRSDLAPSAARNSPR